MKYLLIIAMLFVGCSSNKGGKRFIKKLDNLCKEHAGRQMTIVIGPEYKTICNDGTTFVSSNGRKFEKVPGTGVKDEPTDNE